MAAWKPRKGVLNVMDNKTVQNNTRFLKATVIAAGLRLFLFSGFCGILLFHCSDPNINAPSINSYHAPAWLYPDHGAYVDGNGTVSCTACHGESLQGEKDISGCANSCHFSASGEPSPPGSDWIHGSTPHVTQLRYAEICNRCHTIMRQYNQEPDACHDCHGQGLSHPLDRAWLDKDSSEFHGQSDLACNTCHDTTVYCNACHFGPSGSRIPAGSSWTHGLNEGHRSFESLQIVCYRCHNLNRSYGHPPGTCHDCHDDD